MFSYQEIKGNLFGAPATSALAHCISKDAAMGAGIAVQFDRRYPNMKPTIQRIKPIMPSVVRYRTVNNRVIYNLITKNRYFEKPTRTNFNIALDKMMQLAVSDGKHDIALPLIGAGLDRLPWNRTQIKLKELAKTYDLNITVYYLNKKPY